MIQIRTLDDLQLSRFVTTYLSAMDPVALAAYCTYRCEDMCV